MSATLLQDNEKCNEPEDDQEPCLHVLTWTVLCFTEHTISNGRLSNFLRAFDEEYENEDGVKGRSPQERFPRDSRNTMCGESLPLSTARCAH